MFVKRTLHLINLVLFVLGTAFLVLNSEFKDGNFLYFFFKAKVYYAAYNKIIFPIGFWICFLLFYFINNLLGQEKLGKHKFLMHGLRFTLCYHFYLLLLTHSNETVLGLSYSVPNFSIYENIFMLIAFICYYLMGINIIRKVTTSGCRFWELIIPVSAIIPYLYLNSPGIHIFYLFISLWIFGIWKVFDKRMQLKNFFEKLKANDYFLIGAIFLLSLVFRLWYAYHFATFELVGYSADGPAYFKSALAFSKGDWGGVNFWHAPFYSLYLSAFICLFGESSAVIFYSQALIGALNPVLAYLIAQKLKLKQGSLIAGILVATSHLCIHYSVVINRAAPLTIMIPLIVYSLLCLRENFGSQKCFILGVIFGATFYYGQETLPVLFLLALYLVWNLWEVKILPKLKIYHSSMVGLGIAVIIFGFNGIYYSQTDKWLPLGRASDPGKASSVWNYNGNTFAEKMIDVGFDPIKSPAESFEVFLEKPLTITHLLSGKLFSEIPDFLLDPGGLFLMPLHLAFDSFYSAHIQFYIYFFLVIGVIVFVSNKSLVKENKLLILGPIIVHIIFCSFLLGTFRFRAPITPLNMILLALAVGLVFFKGKPLEMNSNQFAIFKIPISFQGAIQIVPRYLVGGATAILVTFLVYYEIIFQSISKPSSQYELAPWTIVDSKRKIFYTKNLGLNETAFSYYIKDDSFDSNMEIRFNMCRKLMPGMKPSYQLAVDGNLIGKPKLMPSGCFKVREPIKLNYDTGMISLFIFISQDGNIGELNPVSLSVVLDDNKKGTVTMPIPSPKVFDEELLQYIKKFTIYATNIKIDKPALYLLP